ncbi:MAG: hypothetical protein ABI621_14640 [Chloroflexota bacterium]
MKSNPLQWIAIILILVTGYLHLITAGEEYSEARYMGVLFLLNFLGSLFAAVGIYKRILSWGWALGIVIAAGSILGYIQSRTVGMPGMEVEAWYDPIGVAALIVEALYLVVFVLAKPWPGSLNQQTDAASRNRSGEPVMYLAGIGSVAIVGLLHLVKSWQTYQIAKDICGITFAITGVNLRALLESQTGTKAMLLAGLFFVNFLLAIFSALGIRRQKFWQGWAIGLFIVVSSLFGILQSNALGVPGLSVTEWSDPVSIAVLMELVFLGVFFLSKPWIGIPGGTSQTLQDRNRQPILITSMLVIVITVGLVSYQFGASNSNHDEHPLPETIIPNDALEQEYGVRLTLVAVTAAGGLVDVRYRIIDPEKAAQLVDEEQGGIMPMVFVGNGDVMLMSDSHMRDQQLIADRMYFDLIPNTQNAVKRGTVVTVGFGDVAVEPTLAQ